MRWIARMLVASLAAVGMALLLASVYQYSVSNPQTTRNTMTMNHSEPLQINDHNIVDLLIKVPLHLDLSKVEWSHSMLSLDLVYPSVQRVLSKKEVYDDLQELIQFGLLKTVNVNQVLIRVLNAESDNSGRLLLAVEAMRDNISLDALRQFQHEEITAEQYIQSQFRITVTKLWKVS